MLALVVGRRRQPVTVTFTANDVLPVPQGVSAVDMTGYGARGVNGSSGTVTQYRRRLTVYGVRRSDGATVTAFSELQKLSGTKPALGSYCDPQVETPSNPTYSSNQACYSEFTDTSYSYTTPPTTGASATGIGKTFPGSLGNVTQTPVTFNNISVTSGSSYNIVVPAGGSITISYYI
jgi:hypothetical protein